MYESKIAQHINDAINECIAFGKGEVERDGLTVIADWAQSDSEATDIDVYLIQNGVIVATLKETNVLE